MEERGVKYGVCLVGVFLFDSSISKESRNLALVLAEMYATSLHPWNCGYLEEGACWIRNADRERFPLIQYLLFHFNNKNWSRDDLYECSLHDLIEVGL